MPVLKTKAIINYNIYAIEAENKLREILASTFKHYKNLDLLYNTSEAAGAGVTSMFGPKSQPRKNDGAPQHKSGIADDLAALRLIQ
jgi:hypothetical protein